LPSNPTKRVYDGLTQAYDYFNRRLFKTELPRCLITMQRKSKAYGYFAGDRFGEIAGTGRADEIALNPQHFAERSTRETLATLVHEMAHLWQHHWGKTGCRGYHNKQWATRMKILGLYPSSTSQPGGKELGHKVSHYIASGGSFDRACEEFLKTGFVIPYGDLWAADEEKTKETPEFDKWQRGMGGHNPRIGSRDGFRADKVLVDPSQTLTPECRNILPANRLDTDIAGFGDQGCAQADFEMLSLACRSLRCVKALAKPVRCMISRKRRACLPLAFFPERQGAQAFGIFQPVERGNYNTRLFAGFERTLILSRTTIGRSYSGKNGGSRTIRIT